MEDTIRGAQHGRCDHRLKPPSIEGQFSRVADIAPPTGLSTLGFDPTRFQTEPPACYRASWQLPGPDSHRQATTSFRSGHDRWTITS
jgi:hypothetical protein